MHKQNTTTKTHLNVVQVIYRGIPNHLVAYTFSPSHLPSSNLFNIEHKGHTAVQVILFAAYNYEEIVE